jgi:hypothetical protein
MKTAISPEEALSSKATKTEIWTTLSSAPLCIGAVPHHDTSQSTLDQTMRLAYESSEQLQKSNALTC